MINPWIEFCKSFDDTNLVLSEEKDVIKEFNKATSEEFKIQFFPYHSKKYKPIPKKILQNNNFEEYLPSQEYNFQLVREAIHRNAIIVIPRAVKIWEKAIPELKSYQQKYSTNSYGNIILSEKNLGNGYSVIIENLNQDKI